MPEATADTPAAPAAPAPAGDDVLRSARAAFEAGDYARVRELCAAHATRKDEVGEQARALLKRIGIDPVQVGVVAACAILLGWIVWRYVV